MHVHYKNRKECHTEKGFEKSREGRGCFDELGAKGNMGVGREAGERMA